MSFYSESKTSQKSFENGKLVDSSEEVVVNDNGNIMVSVTGTPSKKVDINAITNTLMKPTPDKSLLERLSELSQSMGQMEEHKSKTEHKSRTEKRKKKSQATTMKKKKMKRRALQSGENSRKKKKSSKKPSKGKSKKAKK